jgi:hypothetical protein
VTLGEVCEHGSLKRQCLPCELVEHMRSLEIAIQAADKLAEAAKNRLQIWTKETFDELTKALAAYEKARGK